MRVCVWKKVEKKRGFRIFSLGYLKRLLHLSIIICRGLAMINESERIREDLEICILDLHRFILASSRDEVHVSPIAFSLTLSF